MMPVIRINDATFSDLKSIATWLGTGTPSETIDRIVREAMERLGMEREDVPSESAETAIDDVIQFNSTPGLSFTKPLIVSINDKEIANPNWAVILIKMIAQVKAKGLEGEKLVRELAVPATHTKYEEEGYRYYSELGISVQGQSATDCWKEVERLAKKWRIPVSVEFQWRQTPKAQYPGKRGALRAGN